MNRAHWARVKLSGVMLCGVMLCGVVLSGVVLSGVVLCGELLAPASAAAASDPTPPGAGRGQVTLDQAAQRALSHFPTVRGTRESLHAAAAASAEKRAARYPSLDLSASATQYEEPMIVYPIHSLLPGTFPPFDETVFAAGITAEYTLFDGGGRGAAIREAEHREEAARAGLLRSEADLLAQVAAKYLEVVARERVLDAHEQRLASLESELRRASLFLSAGKSARVDSLRAVAALTAARAEAVTLSTGLALAERELAQLTGIPRDSTLASFLAPVALVDETVPPAEPLIEEALAANPEVVAGVQAAAAERSGADGARGARWPTLRLVGHYQVWSDPDGHSSGEWSAGVALTQTLFSGGEVSSRITQRDAGARRAEEDLRLTRIIVGRQVQEARDRALAAGARRASLIAAVSQYEEVARIEALSLEAGAGTQTEYLSAQADLFQARATLAEAERSLVLAHVELALLTSELSLGWMASHLEEGR